jgi:ribonuclease P protein component
MSGASPARQGFARPQRVLKAAEFDAVYSRRQRVVDSIFSVNAAPNTLGHARLGLSIGNKAVGNSVARNRVKRVVRDSFRHIAMDLGSFDLVVGARNGARTAHNARLRESLEGLWKEIQKRCVVS